MGFFSWKCAKSGVSIPNHYNEFDDKYSEVVLVTADNRKIKGSYDGYGRVNGKEIFTEVARALEGTEGLSDEELRRLYFQNQSPVKIVMQHHYDGEDYADLDISEDCPYQGWFYDEEYVKEHFLGGDSDA